MGHLLLTQPAQNFGKKKKKKKHWFTFIAYKWENTNNFDVLKFHFLKIKKKKKTHKLMNIVMKIEMYTLCIVHSIQEYTVKGIIRV